MTTRRTTANRPRSTSARSKPMPNYASPCTSPSSLRKSAYANVIAKHVKFFRSQKHHPEVCVGWWCDYPARMKCLITYLADPTDHDYAEWLTFREKVAVQLNNCRQCAIQYHGALTDWELSEELTTLPIKLAKSRVKSLLDWDCDRLVPLILKGVRVDDHNRNHRAAKIQCREAFLEALVSLRLCLNPRLCNSLGEVFRHRAPAENATEVTPFIRSLNFVPSGLFALCFHEMPAVRSWAVLMYKSVRNGLETPTEPLYFLLRKTLKTAQKLQESLEAGTIVNNERLIADWRRLDELWDSLSIIIMNLEKSAVVGFAHIYKQAQLMKIVASLLTSKSEGVVVAIQKVIRTLLRTLSFEWIFDSKTVTPKWLLEQVLLAVSRRDNKCSTREKLIRLLSLVMGVANQRCDRESVSALFQQCFEEMYQIAEVATTSGLRSAVDSHKLSNVSGRTDDQRSLLKAIASLLVHFYRHSVPKLPVSSPIMIANVTTAALHEDPSSQWGWLLFRTVILTDVFNVIRVLKSSKDMDVISDTFLAKTPRSTDRSPEEEAVLVDILQTRGDATANLNWVGPLWRKIMCGNHVKYTKDNESEVIDREMSVLMDVHRVIGMLDTRQITIALNASSSRTLLPAMEKDRERRQIVEIVDLIQNTVAGRFHFACSRGSAKGWIADLPFHATHLLSSCNKDVAMRCMKTLQKSYHLQDAVSVRTSQSKLLALVMKGDVQASDMVATGCASSLRLIFALSDLVSIRTYTCFFLWYRILLDSHYTVLFQDGSQWALGVIRSFSGNWQSYESNIELTEFREACCRFLAQLREVWERIIDFVDINDETKKTESWIVRSVLQGLFKMHSLKDQATLGAWAQTMGHIAKSWSSSSEHRAVACHIISAHAKGSVVGSRLTYEQCLKLANLGNLDSAVLVLEAWAKRMKAKPVRSTTLNVQRETKIDQFFPRISPSQSMGNPSGPSFTSRLGSTRTSMPFRPIASRTRLPLMRAVAKSGRSRNTLSELRKEHQSECLRPQRTTTRRDLRPAGQPAKTLFELQREKALAKKKNAARNTDRPVHGLELHALAVDGEISGNNAKTENLETPATISDEELEVQALDQCSVPSELRKVTARDMDLVFRDLIREADPILPETKSTRKNNTKFDSAKDYIDFWEPLLISECRASGKKMVAEERNFAAQFQTDPQGHKFCRTTFEVQEPASSVGYLHSLSLIMHNDSSGNSNESSKDRVTSEFSVLDAQVTDMVYLFIPPPRQSETAAISHVEAIGLVSGLKWNKGELNLDLQLWFDAGLNRAPGKGRRIKISRLMSIAPFQRQIEALWSLPSLPDGILWPILDPLSGFSVNDKVRSRNHDTSLHLTTSPSDSVSKLFSAGCLNDSQKEAIDTVLLSSASLYNYHGSLPGRSLFKKNHGDMTLIQGPPGTGKTSTIINLLSVLLFSPSQRSYPRAERIFINETPLRIKIPAIRVLVCAASNAAVDEIMLRVVHDGLSAPCGAKACPKLVRVGRGTSNEQLKMLELRSLAKCNQACTSKGSNESSVSSRLEDRCRALKLINEKISALDTKRRELKALQKGQVSEANSSKKECELSEHIRSATKELTFMHERKEKMKEYLSQDRDVIKEENQARKIEKMKRMCNVLNQSSLVFATLNSAGHDLMKTLAARFDVVVIDEAAQCIEPDALIPMTTGSKRKGSSKFCHIVMVGDPKQLPATVLSENPRVSKPMSTSLFERAVMADTSRVIMLKTQYRMHPAISRFPSKTFYRGLLENGSNVLEESYNCSFHKDPQMRFGPTSFFDTSRIDTIEQRRGNGSISNPGEAAVVMTILISLSKLYRFEDLNDKIAVLSPYRHQVALMKQLIRDCDSVRSQSIEVSTIDGIQGREKSIIILSTVRDRNSKSIGFVNDERRMNVALTRAKHSLIIVGNAAVLSEGSRIWNQLICEYRDASQMFILPRRSESLFPEGRLDADVKPANISMTSKSNSMRYVKSAVVDAKSSRDEPRMKLENSRKIEQRCNGFRGSSRDMGDINDYRNLCPSDKVQASRSKGRDQRQTTNKRINNSNACNATTEGNAERRADRSRIYQSSSSEKANTNNNHVAGTPTPYYANEVTQTRSFKRQLPSDIRQVRDREVKRRQVHGDVPSRPHILQRLGTKRSVQPSQELNGRTRERPGRRRTERRPCVTEDPRERID